VCQLPEPLALASTQRSVPALTIRAGHLLVTESALVACLAVSAEFAWSTESVGASFFTTFFTTLVLDEPSGNVEVRRGGAASAELSGRPRWSAKGPLIERATRGSGPREAG
jgi:hypothetical protein